MVDKRDLVNAAFYYDFVVVVVNLSGPRCMLFLL